MSDQDKNFYLINLSILITCVRDIVKIFFREKLLVDPVWECKYLTFFLSAVIPGDLILFFIYVAYNQQVVAFLSQPNIDDILKTKYQGYARSPTLK